MSGYQVEMAFNGTRVLLPVENIDDTESNIIERYEGALAYYQTKGFSLPANASVANETVSLRDRMGVPPAPQPAAFAQPSAQGFPTCPFHGTQKIKAGYQGRGWECGVNVGSEPAYPFRKWQGRQGDWMYTCNWKSS